MIYGKLPPEIRKDQARRFNDPDSEIKYLIATNAVNNLMTFFKIHADRDGCQFEN